MLNKYYTEEEIQVLKDYYPISTNEEMLKLLPNRNSASIHTKASKLGLTKDNRWTESELCALKQWLQEGKKHKEIYQLFKGRHSLPDISRKGQKMNLITRRKWTEDEIQILCSYYPVAPIDEFIGMLNNRTRHAIIGKAVKLGLQSYVFWTKEDEDFVINNWHIMSDYEMAKILNVSQLRVKTKRQHLGLFRTDRYSKHYESISKFIRSNNTDWKRMSMEACGYKCVITGENFDEIHHLTNVSTILHKTLNILGYEYKNFETYTDGELYKILDTFIDIQAQEPLGVCLKKDIHVLFHNLYGQSNNTPEQFYHFKEEFLKGTYNELISNDIL